MRKKAPPAQAYAQISRKLMLRAPAEKPAAARHHAQAYALQDISGTQYEYKFWGTAESGKEGNVPEDGREKKLCAKGGAEARSAESH